MSNQLQLIVEHIANEVKRLAQLVISDPAVGVNRKTGLNTLKDSKLYNNVAVTIQNSDESVIIQALFDNHIDYIERGRKPRSGKKPPISALRDWAVARGIDASNNTLFMIANAIWRDGIQPRPILSRIEQQIEEQFDAVWSDLLLDTIIEDLTAYFN